MANSMLRAALVTTSEGERRHLVIHADCGCHYRWPEWISICDEVGVTLDELAARIDAYIERYNTKRIKHSLGSMSPLRFRESLGLAA
ncbi:MAG: IS3 family transposase [Atopobiaceae bacterium]|jgi:transposase InsO family protein|nr:IS3 family transposase [Atopobiaceae bacterium]